MPVIDPRYRAAWYALAAVAVVVILFELFFRYRYVAAGNHLWRIDRVTERACVVRVGEPICSEASAPHVARAAAPQNPYLASPTPEPNPP
jgi:hypothetical protein